MASELGWHDQVIENPYTYMKHTRHTVMEKSGRKIFSQSENKVGQKVMNFAFMASKLISVIIYYIFVIKSKYRL